MCYYFLIYSYFSFLLILFFFLTFQKIFLKSWWKLCRRRNRRQLWWKTWIFNLIAQWYVMIWEISSLRYVRRFLSYLRRTILERHLCTSVSRRYKTYVAGVYLLWSCSLYKRDKVSNHRLNEPEKEAQLPSRVDEKFYVTWE